MAPFIAHGYVRADDTQYLYPGHLTTESEQENFYVHGEGVHDHRRCLVLRTMARSAGPKEASYDEFWVDPARKSVIVRQVHYTRSRVSFDYVLSYNQSGIDWLLSAWTFTHKNSRGQTLIVANMRVLEATANPPLSPEDFQIEAKPGMLIREDHFTGDGLARAPTDEKNARLFRVDDAGNWIEIVDGVELPIQSRYWPWIVGAVCILIILAVGAMVHHWRKRV
jgi:hypothetical protein